MRPAASAGGLAIYLLDRDDQLVYYADMRPEEIHKMLRKQPFIPFRLFLSDATTYDVRHPDLVLLTRSTLILGTAEKMNSGIADDYVYISLLHIVRIELLHDQPAGTA